MGGRVAREAVWDVGEGEGRVARRGQEGIGAERAASSAEDGSGGWGGARSAEAVGRRMKLGQVPKEVAASGELLEQAAVDRAGNTAVGGT